MKKIWKEMKEPLNLVYVCVQVHQVFCFLLFMKFWDANQIED